MSIATEITRINNNIASAYTSCYNKGATMPVTQNSANLADTIDSITGGSTPTDIYRVNSIAERDALTGLNANDLCVVFEPGLVKFNGTYPNIGNMQKEWSFPSTIVLNTAVSSSSSARLSCGTTANTIWLSLSSTEFTVKQGRTSSAGTTRASYTSSDGLTYTRTSQDSTYTFSTTPSYYSSSTAPNDTMKNFILFSDIIFNGIYTYNGTSWAYTDIAIPTKASNVLDGYNAYTNSGIIQGNLFSDNETSMQTAIPAVENYLKNLNTYTSLTDCSSLYEGFTGTQIKTLSLLNTSNVTLMGSMFRTCRNLTSIDLSTLDTGNVISMAGMFRTCTSLTSIDLSDIDTTSLRNMDSMFYGCTNLTSIDFSSLITATTRSEYTFYNCTSLMSLDIRNFDISNAINTTGMFTNVPTDCLIIVKDNTAKTWMNTTFPSLTNVKTPEEM